MTTIAVQAIIVLFLVCLASPSFAEDWFRMPENTQTRWFDFENPTGAKGEGGKRNDGAKGAAFEPLKAGETKTLMEVSGQGMIRRMWFTLRDRDPESLRSYVLRCYWDGAEHPAVEVPFGDFFGAIHGRTVAFQSELFANPEGRSFNCYIPMPFRKSARVTLTNESSKDLSQLFYDIDITLGETHGSDVLYFHATWHRERWTTLGKDFQILPKVAGKGRYLGAHIGVLGHPDNAGWFGEGEVKIYLDGDAQWPTIVGTGTEDYIGTAYGQGVFSNRYQGSLIVDDKAHRYAFYRYHVPDPVYFHQDIRVTIQQMGGAGHKQVLELLEKGVAIDPVSVMNDEEANLLKERKTPLDLKDTKYAGAWTNMYRRDDVCAVALFYLDKTENGLPPIAPIKERVEGLGE